MDENRRLGPPVSQSPHRRFVYRAVEEETNLSYPLRRATDTPHQAQGIAGELYPSPLLLNFRVYLKLS